MIIKIIDTPATAPITQKVINMTNALVPKFLIGLFLNLEVIKTIADQRPVPNIPTVIPLTILFIISSMFN